jgi:hypothetical protein
MSIVEGKAVSLLEDNSDDKHKGWKIESLWFLKVIYKSWMILLRPGYVSEYNTIISSVVTNSSLHSNFMVKFVIKTNKYKLLIHKSDHYSYLYWVHVD